MNLRAINIQALRKPNMVFLGPILGEACCLPPRSC